MLEEKWHLWAIVFLASKKSPFFYSALRTLNNVNTTDQNNYICLKQDQNFNKNWHTTDKQDQNY